MRTVKINFAFLALWLMASFAGNAQTIKYTISGEIKGLGNDTLVMTILDGAKGDMQTLKAAGNKDRFSVTGESDKILVVFAQINKRSRDGNFTFILDKGEIKIFGNSSRIEETIVTGTPINDDYSRGMKTINGFYNSRTAYYQQLKKIEDKGSAPYLKLMQKITAVTDSLLDFQLTSIKLHPESMFSAMQLYVLTDKISILELETLYNSLQSPAKELTLLKNIPSRIKAKKAVQLGNVAPSFSATDRNGKLIRLEDYKGKYVLLDFWASWCGPCRKENPGLIKAYTQFKGKPFEIISVAESDTDAKWRKAISDDKLGEWIHIFDLKDGKNVIGLQYGVQPIPDNFLIDPNGDIIGRNLFGTALENKLKAVLE